MIPSIRTDFPMPSEEEQPELDASTRALSNREAEAARERQQAIRMESMVQTAQQSILAETLAAPTPIAALRYKSLRTQQREQLAASAQQAKRAGLSDEQRAALERATELKASRAREAMATAEGDGGSEAAEAAAPKPEATEADVRSLASAILADLMAAETPVATAKAARWRKETQRRLAPTQGSLKEEARLGGRRTGDRVRLEEEQGASRPGTEERSCRPRVA